jgi:hypothetical protein
MLGLVWTGWNPQIIQGLDLASIAPGDHSTVGIDHLDTARPGGTDCYGSASSTTRHASIAHWRHRSADTRFGRRHKCRLLAQLNLTAPEKRGKTDDRRNRAAHSAFHSSVAAVFQLLDAKAPIQRHSDGGPIRVILSLGAVHRAAIGEGIARTIFIVPAVRAMTAQSYTARPGPLICVSTEPSPQVGLVQPARSQM